GRSRKCTPPARPAQMARSSKKDVPPEIASRSTQTSWPVVTIRDRTISYRTPRLLYLKSFLSGDPRRREHCLSCPPQIAHGLLHSLGHGDLRKRKIRARIIDLLVADLTVHFQDAVVVLEEMPGHCAAEGVL